MIPFPNKKYQIIYADPPWYFSGNFGKVGKSKLSGYGASLRYDLMKNKDIISLPVADLCAVNCALFLWVVNSQLDFGIEVLKKWGFEYKQIAFCWVKTSRQGIPNCRLGYWTLGGIELCLLGIKGKMGKNRKTKNVRQVLLHPRIGHSKKPSQIRKNIELLFGDLPRIELFARERVDGWDVWGNELKEEEIMAKKKETELIEKEAFVTVTTTVLGKQKQKVKKIKIRPFVTDTAHVSVKYGMTIPTGDYASARVAVMISTPCYKEELIDEYKTVRKLVDKLITIEVDKLTSGGSE